LERIGGIVGNYEALEAIRVEPQVRAGAAIRSGDAADWCVRAPQPAFAYGTDAYESELVGDRVCEEATRGGAKVVMLPTIPYGVQSNMLDIPLAINVYPSTLFVLLKDIADSLERHGIAKLVIFNSHGGNDFLKPFIREMSGRSKVFICVIDWWRVGKDVYDKIFDNPTITPARWRRASCWR
jgi:hypothetical protein